MDPLTAIGLASAVVQFVDFSTKLISGAHKLYESASGATSEHLELEGLASNLRQQSEEVTPLNVANAAALSGEDKDLISLGRQCRDVADELLTVLDGLKLKDGSYKRIRSFYLTLKSVRKEDEIVAIQKRLDRIGSVMRDVTLKKLQTKALKILDGLEQQNQNLEAAREQDIIKLQKAIQDSAKDISQQIQGEERRFRESAMSEALALLSLSAKKSIEYSAEQRILDFLRYDDMGYRQVNLRSAHDKTFSWILDSSNPTGENLCSSKFVDWLTSNDNLFWISGKIGSGKSTLMKYICNHDLVQRNLKKWCDGCQLVITSFFFWNASKSVLPKSKEGLLRSILYQILRQAPDLIQYAPPGQWDTYSSSNLGNHELGQDFLTVPELLAAFNRISAHLAATKIKFCFFIDGLDEYVGKPDEILPLIESLKKSPRVKMCVSSRRWNHFEKAFGQDSSRKLYIELYTANDIEIFVRETLEKSPDYQEIVEDDESSIDLIKEIVGEYSSLVSG
jgi:hypothetical protein